MKCRLGSTERGIQGAVFSPENGVIYSRGVLDNKGPVMACLYGLAAVRALGLPLRHPVRIIFGCDEETGFEDLRYYLSKEKPPVSGAGNWAYERHPLLDA